MPHSNRDSNLSFRILAVSWLLAMPAVSSCDILGSPTELTLPTDSADYSVLFIGNSYLGYNQLTWMFDQLAFSVGRTVFVRDHIIYGTSLQEHSMLFYTEAAIQEYDWDFVVLQGSSYQAGYPELSAESIPAALGVLKGMIDDNYAGTRTVYMMGWAYEDGMWWDDGSAETYAEMQQKIYDNTLGWADSLDLIVAPVGRAWQDVLQDHTQAHYLHSADLSHPNLRGSYLSACVFVATLFGRSVEDSDYTGGIAEAEALELQQAASSIVLDSLELWNADPVASPAWLARLDGR